MASERGMLFSAPMVRAILDGRKTQTRRIINSDWFRCLDPHDAEDLARAVSQCPHGRVGDRIRVRETWAAMIDEDTLRAKGPAQPSDRIVYRATDCAADKEWPGFTWRPSLFMPRWASRITLEITEVRTEQLRDISDADALAEGVDPYEWSGGPANPSPRAAFAELWDKLNRKRAPWASNPWVWCVTFKRVATARRAA